MSNADFDSDEQDFQQEVAAALRANRAEAGPCPKPELLMAVESGVDVPGADQIRKHAEQCAICTQLARDLKDYEFPAATDIEDRRMRARWERSRSAQPPKWALFAAAAVAIFIIGAIFMTYAARKTPGPSIAEKSSTPPASQPAAVFTLAKAQIKIPAAEALTFRSDADRDKSYLTNLAAAMEPYRRDDYKDAAGKLDALVKRYPNQAAPAFYAGVSKLFLGDSSAAIASLETADRFNDETLRDDIAWYLAIAYERAGKTGAAKQEAESLCARPGEYQERSCRAAAELHPR